MFSVLAAFPLMEGCSIFRSAQRNAAEAYKQGQYLDSMEYYSKVDSRKLSDADRAMVEEVGRTSEALVGYFLKEAAAATASRYEQRNDYQRAVTSLTEALRFMPADHPERPKTTQRLKEIQDKLVADEKLFFTKVAELKKFVEELGLLRDRFVELKKGERPVKIGEMDELKAKITSILEKGKGGMDITIEMASNLETLRVKRRVLKRNDGIPFELALAMVQILEDLGDYVRAASIVDNAKAVDLGEADFVGDTQIDEGMIKKFAIVKARAEVIKAEKEAARIKEVERLTADLQRAIAEKRYPDAQSIARQMGERGAGRQATIMLSNAARKPGRSRVAKVVASSATQTALPGESEEAVAEREELSSIKVMLEELKAQYKEGNTFEAITQLLSSISDFSESKNVGLLNKQLEAWAGERNKLIAEMQRKADKLFIEEDPAALEAYRNLLRLNPSDDIRRQVAEKIKTLESILGK